MEMNAEIFENDSNSMLAEKKSKWFIILKLNAFADLNIWISQSFFISIWGCFFRISFRNLLNVFIIFVFFEIFEKLKSIIIPSRRKNSRNLSLKKCWFRSQYIAYNFWYIAKASFKYQMIFFIFVVLITKGISNFEK